MIKSCLAPMVAMCIVFGPGEQAFAYAPPEGDEEAGDALGDPETMGARRIIMAPMNISVFDRGSLAARANIELIIEVKKIEDAEETKMRLPQLRADFLSALSQLSRENFRIDRPLNPDLIKLYVMTYAERRLGKGKVDIYVKQAFVQPIEGVG